MATIETNGFQVQVHPTAPVSQNNKFTRWGRGNFLIWDWSLARNSDPAEASQSEPIFRGRVGNNYVYSTGSPPAGATDFVIVGFTTV